MRKVAAVIIAVLLLPSFASAAIAFGHSSSATVGASPRTVAHDATGDNYLVVAAGVGSGTNTVTGITYNGTPMTFITSVAPDAGLNDYYIVVYGLANPTTGSNNITVTTSSGSVGISALSYSGANGGLDNSATNSVIGATSLTCTLTTVANAWTVMFASDGTSNPAAGTGSTARVTGTPGGFSSFDSNAALSAGSNSMTFTWAPIQDGNCAIVSLSPTAPTPPPTLYRAPLRINWGSIRINNGELRIR